MFRKIEKNSHENACARAFFLIKSQAPPNFIKKRDSGTGVFLF